jgi:hypothetical protein
LPSAKFKTGKIGKKASQRTTIELVASTNMVYVEVLMVVILCFSTFPIGILQMASELFRNSSRIIKRDYSNYVARVMKCRQKEQDSYDVSKDYYHFPIGILEEFLKNSVNM